MLAADGESILCLKCGKRSYNKNDVRERYCGGCHRFHDQRLMTAVNALSLREAAEAALHALRSYQYGNTAPDLAEGCADVLEAALKKASA
jgi:hypothetical protein